LQAKCTFSANSAGIAKTFARLFALDAPQLSGKTFSLRH